MSTQENPTTVSATADITPYGLTKLVNAAGVKALGSRWAHVREQHMYNYRKNGMLKGISSNGKLTTEAANAFVTKFVAARVAKLGTS